MQGKEIEKRSLGSSGLVTAPLVFGGNVFGWTVDQTGASELLDRFVDAGFNMVDTADVYSNWIPGNRGGESESIIGKWLKSGKRDRVMIATKVGLDMGNGRKGLSRKHILRSAEESLTRLKTEYIDLYQSHTEDKEAPQEETLEAYSELINAGKVRAIGASNFSAQTLAQALEISGNKDLPKYTSLQPHYNLYEREIFEGELEKICRESNLGVIPYFSLASGFLTGKYRSEKDLANRSRGSRVQKYLNPRGLRILAALDKAAKDHDATPAQISLAWLLAKPAIIKQLNELLGATRVKLDPSALQALDRASAYSEGERQIA